MNIEQWHERLELGALSEMVIARQCLPVVVIKLRLDNVSLASDEDLLKKCAPYFSWTYYGSIVVSL